MSSPALLAGLSFNGSASAAAPKANDPERVRDTAQQFEALLIAQLLRSAHSSEGGWLGSGGDSASDCAFDLADQQLALTMAQGGGLGLAKLVAQGIGEKT